jgi:murein L,D-transpeptidase YcbB/YkuD
MARFHCGLSLSIRLTGRARWVIHTRCPPKQTAVPPSSANSGVFNNVTKCLLIGAIIVGVWFAMGAESQPADPIIERVQAVIKARLDADPAQSPLTCQGERICGIEMLPGTYGKKEHRPLWIDASLQLTKAKALAESIRRAREDGLTPQDYHLKTIVNLINDIREQSFTAGPASVSAELWTDLDLILTDAFLLYASHLAAGRVNPETLHTDWKINQGTVDLVALLDGAATTGDIDVALESVRPAHNGYMILRGALARLRGLAAAGGWPMLAPVITLRPGERNSAVGDLRRRLALSGDLDLRNAIADPHFFDASLAAVVKQFQYRNGLETDGIVGRDTYDRLNIPVEERIRQVVLNLERWRWLPRDLGVRYIIVNTADFKLAAVASGQVVLQMRVVVGRPARRSPVFSARMTHMVINPYWNVPTTIAVEDILPEIQKDNAYLTKRGFRVFTNWTVDAPEVDPTTVDWQAYHANRFPFKIRQDPGPDNELGRIKFMFPNPFAVYLHDTPNRTLFKQAQRDFSSGCIRVEAPVALATFVTAEDKRWTADAILERINTGVTQTVRLKHAIPVHLLYMTAWADETGAVHYRSDIYGRDRELDLALNRRRPNRLPDFVHPQGNQAITGR